MNGTLKLLIISFFIPSVLSAQVWADKVISYSSQKSDKIYSAEQALGSPSINKGFGKTYCSWTPEFDFKKNYEFLHLGFSEEIASNSIIIHANSGKDEIKGVLVFDVAGNEYEVFSENKSIKDDSGLIQIFLEKELIIKSVKVIINGKPKFEEVQIDAIGIQDNSNPFQIRINKIEDELYNSNPINLGYSVNSKYSELAPLITSDGNMLFFVRDNHPNNIGLEKNQDIWYSEKNSDNKWSKAINIDRPVNTTGNDFAVSTLRNGNELLLGNKYRGDKLLRGLSVTSKKNNDEWNIPLDFDFPEIDAESRFKNYHLSDSRNIMLIAYHSNDGEGVVDIHVSFKKNDGSWTEPKNLGHKINTAANETSPFLASDEKTLYFSTSGYPGFGKSDIFMSKRLDDTWTNWSEPINLGSTVNSENWDAYFTITNDGKKAYFVSNNNSIGKEDIFEIDLPSKAQPEGIVTVVGKVLNKKTNKPLSANIKYFSLESNEIKGSTKSDSSSGRYELYLPRDEIYSIQAYSENYFSENENVDLVDTDTSIIMSLNLYLVPVEKGQTVKLNNLFFKFGKSNLLPQSYNELDRILDFLMNNKEVKIFIKGYTDTIGDESRNQKLSEDRAEKVFQYLVENGINKNRLEYKGFGETNSETQQENNRKVEFEIIEK